MSKTAYSVADGHVLRGTEKIAAYVDGVVDFLPGKDKYRAPVVAFLRKQGLTADVSPMQPEGTETPIAANPEAVREQGDPLPPPEEKPTPVTVVPTISPRAVKDIPVSKVDPIKSKTYPDAPAMDPAMGDKTPAFVNWLYANHPEDAAKRYANRIVSR